MSEAGDASDTRRLRGWFRRKLVAPLAAQLAQGVTPEALARSLAFGLVLACCPIVGATTALCALAAALFKLNHVAIQVVNYAASPLQLALLLPFWRLGDRLFGAEPLPIAPARVIALFRADFFAATALYARSALRGTLVYALCAPFALALADVTFRTLARRLARRRG